MDTRKTRGWASVAKCNITQSGDTWLVPSATDQKNTYVVRLNPEKPYCSCPDYDALGGPRLADGTAAFRCKHSFAVEIVRRRSLFPDGSETVTQTVTVTETIKRKTYKQEWPAYNAAQTNEKDKFQSLLHDLCRHIVTPAQPKGGRPRLPLADAIFAACVKVYSTFSGRRFMSDMREAHKRGYIARVPHFNTIFNTLEDPAVFDILRDLILEASLPLKALKQISR